MDITSIPFIALLAFIGGFLLNFMPCVFPVVSLKLLSLMEAKDRSSFYRQMFSYTAGILLTFFILGLILVFASQAGAKLTWGYQLQSPFFVSILLYVVLVLGISLSGYIDISFASTRVNGFFSGVLVSVLATPCTAPFMATAIGVALTQTPVVSLLIIEGVGLGLASPYFFLWPLAKLLKPGVWMVKFQQLLAFPFYYTAIWLLWVLHRQGGFAFGIAALVAITTLALVIFVIRLFPLSSETKKLFVVACLIAAMGPIFGVKESRDRESKVLMENQISFSSTELKNIISHHTPLLVSVTADWCMTCKTNEIVLRSYSVRDFLKENNISYMKADITNHNREISQYLQSLQLNGIPAYVFYDNKGGVRIKVGLVTKNSFIEFLQGPSEK